VLAMVVSIKTKPAELTRFKRADAAIIEVYMSILTQKEDGGITSQVTEVAVNMIIAVESEASNVTDLANRILAQKFTICRYGHKLDKVPKPATLTWAEFREEFSQHPVRLQKDGSAWSPVSIVKGGTRNNESVDLVYFAMLDIDTNTPYEPLLERFSDFTYLAHSSFRHTNEYHKYRVILPLAVPVPASEWETVWARFNQMVGGINDASVKDASRLYYTPGHPIGTDCHFVKENQGKLLSLADLPELAIPVKTNSVNASSTDTYSKKQPKLEGDWTNEAELGLEQGLIEVVNRCPFMQFASSPGNQPDLSEPHWQAMISNACRFETGEDWVHAASEHHPEYDEHLTDKKIAHAISGSDPITCQRIRDLGFKGCPSGGCRRPNGQVTKAPAGLSGWMYQKQLTATQTVTNQIPDEYQVDEFWVKPEGVFQSKYNKQTETAYEIKLCSRIDVTAQTRDETNGNWGIELNFKDPDGVAKSWALPKELLSSAGESYRASLFRMGADVGVSKEAKDGLAEYFNTAKPQARALSVRQPGWFNGSFVLPDAVYGQANERVVFQTNDPEELKRFSQKGTLQSWQEQVASICQGNSRAVLSVCVGLAPPLLKLLDEANGGFHLRGNSSCGKTLCLVAGSSVWGGDTLIRTWNMTVNGLEGVAAMHNDVLLPLDELGQADGKAAGDAAYMIGNGQGKSRAGKDGDARAVKTFRTLLLSSGERSLSDVMASAGQTALAGQEVRMIEIAADVGSGWGAFEDIHGARTSQEFAEQLKKAMNENNGHAGRAFVSFLADTELQPKLVTQVKTTIQRFVDTYVPEGSVGQVSRVGRRFGLVAAAGELCIELGILPWPEGEAIDACRKCFQAWIELRGGIGNHEAEQAIATVRRFIEMHGESRFSAWNETLEGSYIGDSPWPSKTINRAGFRRITEDGRTDYYILPEAYRDVVCAGLNATSVTKELVKRGFLHTTSEGKPQVEVRLPSIGKKRVYHLKADILGEVSDLSPN
jgi:uncharacterized protein (DUF927 family)